MQHRLTRCEATSLMVGAGVGAGVMAVPYLAGQVGLVGLAVILPIAWAASSLIHLMLAEVLFRTGKDMQIVELMHLYVLRGRIGQWVLWAVFALLSIAFLANLAAYVSGAGEIVASLTGVSLRVAEVFIHAISASVVFFGLRAVGIAERFGALALVGLIAAIGVGAIGVPFRLQSGLTGSTTQWLALYGMVMYALWTFYSVPQVVQGLGPDRRGAVRAILVGLGINGILTAVVALITRDWSALASSCPIRHQPGQSSAPAIVRRVPTSRYRFSLPVALRLIAVPLSYASWLFTFVISTFVFSSSLIFPKRCRSL